MDGYSYIFNEAINNYKNHGSRLENFRDIKNNPMLYNFMINGGEIDEDSLSRANQINEELYNKFLKQKKKGLTGYKGVEDLYREIDDHDSKHILILTLIFNNNINFNNIVEIGGGYGNCIRLINNIINYKSWNIIDLPHILEVQEYFLKKEINDISKIKFINGLENNYEINNIDLVIGTHSLSELSWDIFINYMEKVINKSKYLFLGYNVNLPSKGLINKKLKYINNKFTIINNYSYTEKTGANVSYTLFKNNL